MDHNLKKLCEVGVITFKVVFLNPNPFHTRTKHDYITNIETGMKTVGKGVWFFMLFILIAVAVQALITAIVTVVVPLLITGGLVAIGLLAYRYYHKIESERRRDAYMGHLYGNLTQYGNLNQGSSYGQQLPPQQQYQQAPPQQYQQAPPQSYQQAPPQQQYQAPAPKQEVPYTDFDEYLKYQQWQQSQQGS